MCDAAMAVPIMIACAAMPPLPGTTITGRHHPHLRGTTRHRRRRAIIHPRRRRQVNIRHRRAIIHLRRQRQTTAISEFRQFKM